MISSDAQGQNQVWLSTTHGCNLVSCNISPAYIFRLLGRRKFAASNVFGSSFLYQIKRLLHRKAIIKIEGRGKQIFFHFLCLRKLIEFSRGRIWREDDELVMNKLWHDLALSYVIAFRAFLTLITDFLWPCVQWWDSFFIPIQRHRTCWFWGSDTGLVYYNKRIRI